MTSKPSGNGLIAAPTAVPFCVKVMFVEFKVIWSRFSLKPMWIKVETGTPVEPFAGPVMLAFTVGATVSIVTAFVCTAVGPAGWAPVQPMFVGIICARNAWPLTAVSSVWMTTK